MIVTKLWNRIQVVCPCHKANLVPGTKQVFPLFCPEKYKNDKGKEVSCDTKITFSQYQWLLESLGNKIAENETGDVKEDLQGFFLIKNKKKYCIADITEDGIYIVSVEKAADTEE